MITQAKRFMGSLELAEGDIPPDAWAMAVVKIGCILIIGIVIISGVVTAANITACSPFYSMYQSVNANINSGYSLAALMVLAVSAAAIMHFLGFM
jgi:hypothetical protein